MEKKKRLPIYKLVITDDVTDGSGVNFVALVDEPATEKVWLAFDKQKPLKFAANQEKRMITGPLMVADMPIYRRDKMGEYYVVFDAHTIEQIVLKFFRMGNQGNVNLMHEKPVDGVFMFESWIINKADGKSSPKAIDELSDGSWAGTFKVDNQTIWDEFIKTGIFRGFSVEGMFEHRITEDEFNIIDEVIKMIKSL